MKACYSNYIYSPWLPLGREAAWNPEAGVQLTPIESVISQDCQVGDALAAQNKRMLIQCSSSASLFDIRAALPLCRPLLGWAGAELPVLFLVSNQSARKLQQQSKIEVTAQEWTNWNRLLWNLQAFADTCWSQHSMSYPGISFIENIHNLNLYNIYPKNGKKIFSLNSSSNFFSHPSNMVAAVGEHITSPTWAKVHHDCYKF